jgi:hypothetical protein
MDHYYFCSGKGCPIKLSCNRFTRGVSPEDRPELNEKKEYHLAWPPYDKDKQKCLWYDGEWSEDILKTIIDIVNEKR